MKKDGIELYVSEDIIQGEDVPFYILWKRDDIKSFSFELDGFSSVIEYHNVKDDISPDLHVVKIDDLKSPHYLGGILKSGVFDNPFKKAYFQVHVILSNDKKIELNEERILYNTSLTIKTLPEIIKIPFDKPPIQIQLCGSTTIFMDMVSSENSELAVKLPDEVLDALEKLYSQIEKGLNNLRTEFTEYASFIDSLLQLFNPPFEEQALDEMLKKFEKVKTDKSFVEALGLAFVNAIFSQTSVKDRIFIPLLSYFASAASEKAFLVSPFSCIYVPEGGGRLKLEIISENIPEYYDDSEIEEKSIQPLIIETNIASDKGVLIPIKELIEIRRKTT